MLVLCPKALEVLQQCPASMHRKLLYTAGLGSQSATWNSIGCAQHAQYHMMGICMDRKFTSCRICLPGETAQGWRKVL